MALMMIAFWGGITWVVVTLLRHGARPPNPHPSEPTAPTPTRLTPTEILAERLARGEIDPDCRESASGSARSRCAARRCRYSQRDPASATLEFLCCVCRITLADRC